MTNNQLKVLRDVLKDSEGRIFSVEFIKRTTGELRKMTARLGVTKHLQGGSKRFSDIEKQLITVFDMEKHAYRSIPLENIIKISINGLEIQTKGAN
jgi:hypothetical protein